MADVTGVILAGGKSRRMGEDKRFLTVGTATLLDRCRSAMMSVFSEVLIVTAQDSPPLEGNGCRVYQDLIPDCGSLGGLYTGLKMATGSRIFIVACDMPFLNQEMIRFFINRDPEADVVMGRLPSGLQPLHAVYGKGALPVLERKAHTHHLKIQDVVSESSLKIVVVDPSEWALIDPASHSFQNVNTPADLLAARTEASRSFLAQ
jgi:molybdopterin-guanine dinucleotide biosynthesis protein A